MVFGYWAIFTAVVCLAGFSYMAYLGFCEDSVDNGPDDTEQEGTSQN